MLFIDNIRWTMILLVLSMHATDTYSPFGDWYYTDRSQTTFTTALIFGSYQSLLQAFFMGLLFFVAGFFAAPSYDRKGFARFVRERCVRLGVPTGLYMLIVGPLTQYFLSHSWGTGSFARQWFLSALACRAPPDDATLFVDRALYGPYPRYRLHQLRKLQQST